VLLREFDVPAEAAVIIGDSDIDMLTGRNAGVWSVGVTYGLSPETLHRTRGDVHIDHPNELAELFGQ
jgi:phosphoglycolate phosphatase